LLRLLILFHAGRLVPSFSTCKGFYSSSSEHSYTLLIFKRIIACLLNKAVHLASCTYRHTLKDSDNGHSNINVSLFKNLQSSPQAIMSALLAQTRKYQCILYYVSKHAFSHKCPCSSPPTGQINDQ
jgi:hypothetical protein